MEGNGLVAKLPMTVETCTSKTKENLKTEKHEEENKLRTSVNVTKGKKNKETENTTDTLPTLMGNKKNKKSASSNVENKDRKSKTANGNKKSTPINCHSNNGGDSDKMTEQTNGIETELKKEGSIYSDTGAINNEQIDETIPMHTAPNKNGIMKQTNELHNQDSFESRGVSSNERDQNGRKAEKKTPSLTNAQNTNRNSGNTVNYNTNTETPFMENPCKITDNNFFMNSFDEADGDKRMRSDFMIDEYIRKMGNRRNMSGGAYGSAEISRENKRNVSGAANLNSSERIFYEINKKREELNEEESQMKTTGTMLYIPTTAAVNMPSNSRKSNFLFTNNLTKFFEKSDLETNTNNSNNRNNTTANNDFNTIKDNCPSSVIHNDNDLRDNLEAFKVRLMNGNNNKCRFASNAFDGLNRNAFMSMDILENFSENKTCNDVFNIPNSSRVRANENATPRRAREMNSRFETKFENAVEDNLSGFLEELVKERADENYFYDLKNDEVFFLNKERNMKHEKIFIPEFFNIPENSKHMFNSFNTTANDYNSTNTTTTTTNNNNNNINNNINNNNNNKSNKNNNKNNNNNNNNCNNNNSNNSSNNNHSNNGEIMNSKNALFKNNMDHFKNIEQQLGVSMSNTRTSNFFDPNIVANETSNWFDYFLDSNQNISAEKYHMEQDMCFNNKNTADDTCVNIPRASHNSSSANYTQDELMNTLFLKKEYFNQMFSKNTNNKKTCKSQQLMKDLKRNLLSDHLMEGEGIYEKGNMSMSENHESLFALKEKYNNSRFSMPSNMIYEKMQHQGTSNLPNSINRSCQYENVEENMFSRFLENAGSTERRLENENKGNCFLNTDLNITELSKLKNKILMNEGGIPRVANNRNSKSMRLMVGGDRVEGGGGGGGEGREGGGESVTGNGSGEEEGRDEEGGVAGGREEEGGGGGKRGGTCTGTDTETGGGTGDLAETGGCSSSGPSSMHYMKESYFNAFIDSVPTYKDPREEYWGNNSSNGSINVFGGSKKNSVPLSHGTHRVSGMNMDTDHPNTMSTINNMTNTATNTTTTTTATNHHNGDLNNNEKGKANSTNSTVHNSNNIISSELSNAGGSYDEKKNKCDFEIDCFDYFKNNDDFKEGDKKNRNSSARFTLIVNVPPNTTRKDLTAVFSKFGNVDLTMVVCDKQSRHPNKEWTATSGYAFVRFSTNLEAQRTLNAASSGLVRIRGSRVRATWAKKDSYSKREKEVTFKIPALNLAMNVDEFICIICKVHLSYNPRLLSCCYSACCSDCLGMYLSSEKNQTSAKCPCCSESISDVIIKIDKNSKGVMALLYKFYCNIKVKCPNENCKWIGTQYQYFSHIISCKHN